MRAYSSIGQSPRLITGLFLVRTQVGLRHPSFSFASRLVSVSSGPSKHLREIFF